MCVNGCMTLAGSPKKKKELYDSHTSQGLIKGK